MPELHGPKVSSSRAHSNVAGSLAEKMKVALVLVESTGPESMVVSGRVVSAGVAVAVAVGVEVGVGGTGVLVGVAVSVAVGVGVGRASTVQVWRVGGSSTLPARSIARTAKVCSPTARPVYATGEVQGPKAAPSSEHWKTSADASVSLSLPVKPKVAELSVLDSSGVPPSVKKVSGGVVSGGTGVLVAVGVGGTGVLVDVGVGSTAVSVGVGVGGTGVLVGMGVAVGGASTVQT
jgi:hypothetical protein